MKAYIHVSDGFTPEVEVKNHPIYPNEIILGKQRLTLYGIQRKDISIISIFPGVKTWCKIRTNDDIYTLVGTIQKTNVGITLVVE